MAARGWVSSTVTATGVAAGAGSAQFGLAYGLGVIGWQPVRDAAGEGLWLASLTWAVWIAATSTVFGAIYACGANARGARDSAAPGAAGPDGVRPRGRMIDLVSRTATALAAAIGALITVPLVMLPARAAQRADTFQPQVTAGAYAVVGVIVGLVVAIVAVNFRVIATNIIASAGWVWILAAVSVVDAVRAHRTVGTAQLAAWQFTDRGWFRETLHLPGAFLMLGGALLVGVFAALSADRRADNRLRIAVSGIFGPLLVAAAYLLAAPRPSLRAEQFSAYLFAPYAVVAGLAGSVFVAVLGPLRPRRPRATNEQLPLPLGDPAPTTAALRGPGEPDLTEWTRTLAADSPAPNLYGSPATAPVTTGTEPPAPGFDPAVTPTGQATATESAPPAVAQQRVPKPRKQRGSAGRAGS